MELKPDTLIEKYYDSNLLIVPYGIETSFTRSQ